jgi:hypothetical protein
MSERNKVKAHMLIDGADAVDDKGMQVCFVRVEMDREHEQYGVAVMWSPLMFIAPIPKALREMIAERMHFHADKLKSGELEVEMRKTITEMGGIESMLQRVKTQ